MSATFQTAAAPRALLDRTSTTSGGAKRWTPVVCSHVDARVSHTQAIDAHGEALPHRNQRERRPD